MKSLYNEKEFYSELIRLIDKDMKSKKLTTYSLKSSDYVISKAQYFNLKRIAKGDTDANRLSNKGLKAICEYLNIKLNGILFDAPGLNKL